jgi:diaminohydroxyphosphoribosylaminopyrimidine deaminase/5-amino-6-(5-phosphoribosylamino)uracil reductase
LTAAGVEKRHGNSLGTSGTASDNAHMQAALVQAARGRNACEPNPRVGCVIVDATGAVAGRGYHARAGGPHAEVAALAEAGAAADGATAYVTLEPCCHHGRTPPCTDALLGAGVRRVVVGAVDPFPAVGGGGLRRLREAGVDVCTGVLADNCRDVCRGFLSRIERGRPFVTVKLATSLDGATAMASGESRWVTGAAARRDVHVRRSHAGAVLTGIGTVLADDPRLTVRGLEDASGWRQPLRVVLDSKLRTPPASNVLRDDADTLILHGTDADPALAEALRAAGASVQAVPSDDDGQLDLAAVLQALGDRGVNEVLVEAGATLAGALLTAGLVDEIVWYFAPHLMGATTLPAWRFDDVATMAGRQALDLRSIRFVGEDLRLIARPARRAGASPRVT